MTERWHRLWLALRCWVASVRRGQAVVAPTHLATVIVVLTGKLGDIVCGTPVLRALRSHLPDVRIIAVGGAVLPPLLADSGLADEYLSLDAPALWAYVRSLQADAAILTGPSFTPAARAYLAGIPLVIVPRVVGGSSPFETIPYRLVRPLFATFPYAKGAYAPRERLRALEPLGIVADDTTKHLGYSANAAKAVEQLLASRREDMLIGISATAGNKIKEWPPERFAAVADHLIESHDAGVVLIGGPGDAEVVGQVLGHMRHASSVLNTQGKLSVDELKALIAKLRLFIAVDTGPIYIAEALGVSVVDIVGPMNEAEQPPRGPKHRVVVPPFERTPQLSVLNARFYDRHEAFRQTLSIDVPHVIRQAEELLGEGERRA